MSPCSPHSLSFLLFLILLSPSPSLPYFPLILSVPSLLFSLHSSPHCPLSSLPSLPLQMSSYLSPPLLCICPITETPSLPCSPRRDVIDEFFGEKPGYGEDVNTSEDDDEDVFLDHTAQSGQREGSGLGISLDGADDEVMSAYQKYRQLKSVLCQCHCLIVTQSATLSFQRHCHWSGTVTTMSF